VENEKNLFANLKYLFYFFIISFFHKFYLKGDWGLGIGDWGLGPIPNPQSPIPI
jgi:hypothetical protein